MTKSARGFWTEVKEILAKIVLAPIAFVVLVVFPPKNQINVEEELRKFQEEQDKLP